MRQDQGIIFYSAWEPTFIKAMLNERALFYPSIFDNESSMEKNNKKLLFSYDSAEKWIISLMEPSF